MPAAIELNNISFSYPNAKVDVLNRISIAVAEGACFGLLGPNGAGKTTLLSILMGLNIPSSGSYFLKGREVSHQSSIIKTTCAIVPQDYAFYPELTGAENLDYFAGLYGLKNQAKKARLRYVVEVAGLSDVLGKRARLYSGGVKRRLNLAIGLLNNPDILFLDEPTVGIDAQSRQFILDSINHLKKTGMTIMYTSHYMEEVQTVCDELAIVDNGSVVVQSSLKALIAEANKNVYTVTVDKQIQNNFLNSSSYTVNQVGSDTLTVEMSDLSTDVPALFAALSEQGLKVNSFSKEKSTLEQVYLDLTSKALRD
ncbi:ABC transporter ATP-binding protein [Aurantivibrio plasticivorans]